MPYTVSEWEWFQLQLQLNLARHKTEHYYIGTEQPGTYNTKPLKILISNRSTEQLIYQRISRRDLLQATMPWVYAAAEIMRQILEHLPRLKKEFDINKDVIYEILCDTGKASHKIAEVIGNQVIWVEEWVKELPE